MSLDEIILTVETIDDVELTIDEFPDVSVDLEPSFDVIMLTAGNVGPQGPYGPTGPQGPIGPQGPEGKPGTAVGSAHYEWKVSTAATDPAHGFIKANNADATLYTEFYASVYTKEGTVVRFDQVEVGGLFLMYELGQLETWNRYEVTAPVVVHDNEWFTVPCVFVESGPLPFTPGGNTQIEVQTPVKGEPGPVGPQGPIGYTGPPGPVGPQGFQGPQGLLGPQGDTGPQGVKGDTGADSTVPGPTGPSGSIGPSGPEGPASTVPGPTGPAGSTGPPGPQGTKGDVGAQGQIGPGVAAGGSAGQVLKKVSSVDYETAWQADNADIDLIYNGDFPANSPYTDGDIVVLNGVPYMCVRPTSSPPVPWQSLGNPIYMMTQAAYDALPSKDSNALYVITDAPANPKVTYGTTAPASPVDGDEWVFPADATNGVMWRFRYRAGSASVYKWEFIGGPPLIHNIVGGTSPAGADTDLGATITLPRAGDYLAGGGYSAGNGYLNGSYFVANLNVAGTNVAQAISGVTGNWASGAPNEYGSPQIPEYRANGLSASAVVKLRGYSAFVAGSIYNQYVKALPVRVS